MGSGISLSPSSRLKLYLEKYNLNNPSNINITDLEICKFIKIHSLKIDWEYNNINFIMFTGKYLFPEMIYDLFFEIYMKFSPQSFIENNYIYGSPLICICKNKNSNAPKLLKKLIESISILDENSKIFSNFNKYHNSELFNACESNVELVKLLLENFNYSNEQISNILSDDINFSAGVEDFLKSLFEKQCDVVDFQS
jgi:hypothetical protein